MQPIERFIVSSDWISILILGIVFTLVLIKSLHSNAFISLFALPYNKRYIITENYSLFTLFNILFFVASNLILGFFIYRWIELQYVEVFDSHSYLFLHILLVLLLFWLIKFIMERFLSYLFEMKDWYIKARFIKMSYYFSSSLYLLILLIFSYYCFTHSLAFLYFSLVFYSILLLIRYYHFVQVYKSHIYSHLFYFILYLCALEIAPILLAIKIGI